MNGDFFVGGGLTWQYTHLSFNLHGNWSSERLIDWQKITRTLFISPQVCLPPKTMHTTEIKWFCHFTTSSPVHFFFFLSWNLPPSYTSVFFWSKPHASFRIWGTACFSHLDSNTYFLTYLFFYNTTCFGLLNKTIQVSSNFITVRSTNM